MGANTVFVRLSMTETMCDSQPSGSNPGVTYVLFVFGLTARANAVASAFGPRLIVAMTAGPSLAAPVVGRVAARSTNDAARTSDFFANFGFVVSMDVLLCQWPILVWAAQLVTGVVACPTRLLCRWWRSIDMASISGSAYCMIASGSMLPVENPATMKACRTWSRPGIPGASAT